MTQTPSTQTSSVTTGKRPRVAGLISEYRRYSHGQNIIDRLMGGYGWESEWHYPELDVVSLYVDQFPESDLSREREQRHPDLHIYPTIAEALTLGGSKLAVDGVVLIAEHGDYPLNEKGQMLYPRYDFFQQTVEVFRASGRTVPVFCDKHLSYNYDWAREMVETAKGLGFPFMAGSSLPVARRVPSIDLPLGSEAEEVVGIGVGSIDSYDIHALEAMQCLAERRQGGETGVKSVRGLRGDSVWQAMDEGAWDPALFEACLCRSLSLKPADETHRHTYPTREELPGLLGRDAIAYQIEYLDGLRATMLLMEGLKQDITAAVRIKNQPDPFSVLFYLGAGHHMQPNFFNPLSHHIENLICKGQPPFPVERTLLTTGTAHAGIDSLHLGEQLVDTPHLDITYQVDETSTFRRS